MLITTIDMRRAEGEAMLSDNDDAGSSPVDDIDYDYHGAARAADDSAAAASEPPPKIVYNLSDFQDDGLGELKRVRAPPS